MVHVNDKTCCDRQKKYDKFNRKYFKQIKGYLIRRVLYVMIMKSKDYTEASEREVERPSVQRWDETPVRSKGGETPGATAGQSTRMWDNTPGHTTPGREASSARRNRWDETPKTDRGDTPGHSSGWAETPRTDRGVGDLIKETPTPSASKRR